jgi:hypothetical protein
MMYRDGKQVISNDEHNFVLNHGALGDIISSLPPVAFARGMYPTMRFKVWVPPWQTDLLKHILAPYGEFEFLDVTKFPKTRAERVAMDMAPLSLNTAVNNTHTRCRVHMVDYAYNFLINAQPESMEQRSYLTKAPLGPKKSNCSTGQRLRRLPGRRDERQQALSRERHGAGHAWCLDNGYALVIVGTKTSHTATEVDGELRPIVIREQTDLLPLEIFKRCIDLREKTTLLELRDVLGHAAAVVGVDGGTLHLAGTTDVPIVFASGTTLPKHRYIPRHGDPSYRIRYVGPRDLECYGCQSNWPLTHDALHRMRVRRQRCAWRSCIRTISSTA